MRKYLSGFTVTGLITLALYTPSIFALTDFAQGKTISASSEDTTQGLLATKAVDGDETTRWSSNYKAGTNLGVTNSADDQWLVVDLGTAQTIEQVRLNWEGAYAANYSIDYSNNNSTWTTALTVTTGQKGL